MSRWLVILTIALGVAAGEPAQAQGLRHLGSRLFPALRDRSPNSFPSADPPIRSRYDDVRAYPDYPPSLFGFSIGFGTYPGYGYSGLGYLDPYRFDGYGYDPYRYGSFDPPDLLNDPYFRERYRYDSRFPGKRRPSRIPRSEISPPAVGARVYRRDAEATDTWRDEIVLSQGSSQANVRRRLRQACEQLSRGLVNVQDGDVWLEYLAPGAIIQHLDGRTSEDLRELLSHYDGVTANPQLRSVTTADGFAETRDLLRQYVDFESPRGDSSRSQNPVEDSAEERPVGSPIDESSLEWLPAPLPDVTPNSRPSGTPQG